MQHKRKTNHERFEEDRNKLAIGYRLSAIGYRLSAIGYRLILGVLVSIFAVTAFAEEWISDSKSGCNFRNPHPQRTVVESIEWSGGSCDNNGFITGRAILQYFHNSKPIYRYEGEFKNGLKNGKGTMTRTGGVKYEGDWLNGEITGRGTYTLTNGSKYVGDWLNDKLQGFAKLSLVKDDKDIQSWVNKSQGRWQGDKYVVEGMFEGFTLTLSCTSPQNCKQKQAEHEAQEKREQAARDEEYRRDAPARQARQMCEAQKQTCVASCPRFVDGRGVRFDFPETPCRNRCESVSCY